VADDDMHIGKTYKNCNSLFRANCSRLC